MSLFGGFYTDINSIPTISLQDQDVIENDMGLRRQFYRWVLRMIREDPTFFQYVLFSDEASFHNNGQLNRYNCHY